MKNSIVLSKVFMTISCVFILQSGIGQVNRYDKPANATFRNTYVSPDFNLMLKVLESKQAKYDQNNQYLIELKNWVLDLRSKTNDNTLIMALNSNYNKLKKLEKQDLSEATIQLQSIEFDIKEAILAYNKRGEVKTIKQEDTGNNNSEANNADRIYQKAITYANDGNLEEALKSFSQVIQLVQDHPDPYSSRGAVYYQMGNTEQALRDFTKALQLNPDHISSLYYRGWLYNQSERFNEAIKDFDKLIQVLPDSQEGYFGRGFAYGNIQKDRQAMEDYKQVLEINPKHSMALNNIGYTYCERGDYDIALDYVNKALEYDTKNYAAWSSRAEIFFHQGLYEECIDASDFALELAPDDGFIYYFRGRANFRLGKTDEACSDWKLAADKGEFKAFDYISKYCN